MCKPIYTCIVLFIYFCFHKSLVSFTFFVFSNVAIIASLYLTLCCYIWNRKKASFGSILVKKHTVCEPRTGKYTRRLDAIRLASCACLVYVEQLCPVLRAWNAIQATFHCDHLRECDIFIALLCWTENDNSLVAWAGNGLSHYGEWRVHAPMNLQLAPTQWSPVRTEAT